MTEEVGDMMRTIDCPCGHRLQAADAYDLQPVA
jgi:hypothetical protein